MKAHSILTQTELDDLLDDAARTPEEFAERARELADRLERDDVQLEIRQPSEWRRPDPHPESRRRPAYTNQFQADVEAIIQMDREEEARLARRIEFARHLVDSARERAGLPPLDGVPLQEGLPPRVYQREAELHSLRTEMVERNLYLVLINVERYAQSNINRWDLIQEGSASLFRAVDGFDWRRGLLFRTYAVHWLNQAGRNYLDNSSHTVRVPVYLQKALKHINQAQIRLGDPQASVEEIAAVADLAENLVATAMSASRASHSIDNAFSEDGDGGRLRDFLAEEDDEGPYTTRLEDVTLEEGLERAMELLSDRERKVVQMRFGIGLERDHTLAEVARELGVSVERVRQIQVRAIAKMNTPTLRRELDPFLN